MGEQISYVKALYPECLWREFRILGIRLRPLSIHALLMLERFNSPFITGNFEVIESEPIIAQAHLLFAALVLSMTDSEFMAWLESDFTEQLFLYGQKLREANPDSFTIGGVLKKEILQEQYMALLNFMLPSLSMPTYSNQVEGDSDESWNVHRFQSLILAGASKCGYTLQEAMNCHLQRVLLDVLRHAQDVGNIRMLTPEQSDMVANPDKYQTTTKIEKA
jgi:hypothetical protein